MKKTLLIASLGLLSMNFQTQAEGLQEWTAKVTGVSTIDELYLQAPVCVDQAGSTYTTGQFTQPITIGSTTLEPIANSAYLAKYHADGTAAWAIGLSGAATITSVTTDESNNVYIAGTFADVVLVGSTDGKTQEIKGAENETNKTASFIASYNADGALQAVRTFLAQTNEDAANSGLYFPDNGYPYITIKHLEADNGKIYASATHTGDVLIDDMKWSGMYLNVFDFMYSDLESGGIFSLNAADLKGAASVAHISVAEQFQSTQMGFENLNFTVDNGTVYLCFVANGKVKYDAAGKSEEITLTYDDLGSFEHAYIVSSIKDATVKTKTFHAPAHTESAAYNRIGALKADDKNLYIGGTFFQQLAFDNEQTHTDGTDLFVAALNKETLELQWSNVSGLSEGDGKYFSENFNAMTVNGGVVSVYGYVLQDQNNEKKITAPLEYSFAGSGAANENGTALITGADRRGETSALRSVNTESLEATLTVSAPTTGIQDVPALETRRVGNTFFFDRATDVQVYDLQGRLLQQARKVTSVSIDHLQQGVYVLTDGRASVKVQK